MTKHDKIMPVTSLTSYFNTTSFGDQNAFTRNQEELALTLDSAAQELGNWKSLIAMSGGGAGFELGKLATRTLLGATPTLCAIPLLTNALTFAAGAMADTGLTGILNQAFGNTEEEESFWARMMDQSSVRGMGLLGAGQSFVVIQLMQGLASAGRGMLENTGRGDRPVAPTFLHSMIQGLQCYFGSGMFGYLSSGAVSGIEQRLALKTKNVNIGVPLQNFGPNLQLETNAGNLHLPISSKAPPESFGWIPKGLRNIFSDSNGEVPPAGRYAYDVLFDQVFAKLSFSKFKSIVMEAEKIPNREERIEFIYKQSIPKKTNGRVAKSHESFVLQCLDRFERIDRERKTRRHQWKKDLQVMKKIIQGIESGSPAVVVTPPKTNEPLTAGELLEIKAIASKIPEGQRWFEPVQYHAPIKRIEFAFIKEHVLIANRLYTEKEKSKKRAYVFEKIWGNKSSNYHMSMSLLHNLKHFASQIRGDPYLESEVEFLKTSLGIVFKTEVR